MKSILLILTVISLAVHGQSEKTHLPLFWDKELIHEVTDSLLRAHAEEIIVIYTDKSFDNIKSYDSLITFIIWRQDNQYFLKAITADKVYKKVKVKGKEIFSMTNKRQTFVNPYELTLKFTPPLTSQNSLFYLSSKQTGYFEQDNPVTYVANADKDKVREKWFNECLSVIGQTKHLEIESTYKRPD